MKGLAVDTASDVLAAALLDGEGVFAAYADAGLRHSERLMALVDGLYAAAGAPDRALDFAACMGGPGSFTGLRIGMATVKGLAVSLDIPFYAIPTLDCIARSRTFWPGTVFAVLDANKGRWYAAEYRRGTKAGPEEDLDGPELARRALLAARSGPVLIAGPNEGKAAIFGGAPLPEGISVEPAQRCGYARELLEIAGERKKAGNPGEADEAGINYMRKSEAELTRETALRKRAEADAAAAGPKKAQEDGGRR